MADSTRSPDEAHAAHPESSRHGSRLRTVATAEGHAVTTFELFFDLVFVFAITQVTALMAADGGGRGLVRGLVLLALLWWAWCSYAWLGNQARADEGFIRTGVIIVMAAMFAVALAIPEAWADGEGGLAAPVVLAVGLAVTRLGHLAMYGLAARGDAGLSRTLVRTAVPVGTAMALLVVGAVIGGSAQTVLWGLALLIDYVGVYLSGSEWRLPSPRHFAERHGLILIIALGESIIAIGVGVAELPLTLPTLITALLGLSVTIALWWAYFDVDAMLCERALVRSTGADRIRLARDAFTYLHFPMLAGIIFFALGLKKVAEYVADTEHHTLSDSLSTPVLWALFGGVAFYLLGNVGFRLRSVGALDRPRIVVAALLLAVPVALGEAPALVALAVLAVLVVGMIAVEVTLYRDARAAVRTEARSGHGE